MYQDKSYRNVQLLIHNAGHADKPHQPVADQHRGGGHAHHGGVHPLQCAHVHHGQQIRDLRAESTNVYLYRVVINERYKVSLYCDFILSPGDFLSLLGAHQVWSI